MKVLNGKNVSALALLVAVSTAAFAHTDLEMIASFEEVSPSITVPVSFHSHLEAQDKANQAQEAYNDSYKKIVLDHGAGAVEYCGQKLADTAASIVEFSPTEFIKANATKEAAIDFVANTALNKLGEAAEPFVGVAGPIAANVVRGIKPQEDWLPIAVDAIGPTVIDAGLDMLGAAAVPLVGPVGPAAAQVLKNANALADWMVPGFKEAKYALVDAAINDYIVPGAIGAANLAYNGAGAVYNGAASAVNYINDWWYGTPAGQH